MKYLTIPSNHKDAPDQKVPRDLVVDTRKLTKSPDGKSLYFDLEWVNVGRNSSPITGWFENTFPAFSAYDWEKMGFKTIEEGAEEYYMPIKEDRCKVILLNGYFFDNLTSWKFNQPRH